ncbi:MAG: hypothetical protein ABIR92_02005 [Gemmatimonadaceae bacterium]
MSKRDLWNRISSYQFEHIVQPELMDRVSAMFGGADASTQAFASKLAVKQGWSRKFALRAIAEYRRFVYLGNVGHRNVTPSKVIDQVWHQHILFSRAYREFCRDIIGREFDHHPELVPLAGQSDIFAKQYLATLDAYRTEFNMMPPSDIWSVPKFRNQELKRAPKKLDQSPGDHWGSDVPLYTFYSSNELDMASTSLGFGGGGDFAGGGSGRDWSDSSSDQSGASDTGDSSSADSGSSDGGSSCSSSCGGGGE